MNIDKSFAADVVRRALAAGGTAAEVLIREETEFSVSVRLGEVETLSEADSRALGLRVLVDGRQASVSTSDLSDEALASLTREAVALARATSIDESADLPDAAVLASDVPELNLFDEDIAELSADAKIAMALRCEQASRDTDPRIVNFDRGGLGTTIGSTIFANSLGFSGEYRSTSISLAAVPVATDGGEMQRDYWFDVSRSLAGLESPEAIGRRAAERTLRRLGARKVESCEVPVLFEPTVARDLLSTILQAVSGEAVYRNASFLTDQLGERIASECLSVVDDGRVLSAVGSRPFDGEGVATRRTSVVSEGVLTSYLLNTYTGRKLGMASTGNAARSLAGPVGVGPGNLAMLAGASSQAEMLRSVHRGFFVTELIGFGVNIVNGDYSRGAAGIWIEDGELTFPVEEVTIAGNLREMLRNVEAVGNDLEYRGRMAAPSILIGRMTVSGR